MISMRAHPGAARVARVDSSAPSRAGHLLQRKCACGAGKSPLGDTCDQCHSQSLQRKLSIGVSNDPLEAEADRVADQILTAGTPRAGVSASPPRIQRATPAATSAANSRSHAAPASVDRVLASSGRPLEPAVRNDMEQRFGHDFSRVRVHVGGMAEQSARDVDARAYTVGHNIVFDSGQFKPGTSQGRRLLAHELTHVVQQSHAPSVLQRWANCSPARLTIPEDGTNCPPRDPGEKSNASSRHMAFLPGLHDIVSGAQGAVIANFDIGKSTIKASLHGQPLWQNFLKKIAKNRSHWRLLGFSDCHGDDGLNTRLRADRAKAVYDILPTTIQAQIVSHEGAPQYDCITENNSAPDRTMNRSVAFVFDHSVADMKGEEVTGCIPPKPQSSSGKKCKFYVYDSTEPFAIGKAWKAAAFAYATPRLGAYVVPSGKSMEEMLSGILATYADKGCDCTDELQFWSHGSSGNGMWISQGGGGEREFTASSFNIPGLARFGDGPTSMPGYRQWSDALSPFQRRLVLLRRTICDTDSEVYYRSCQAFQGKKGQDFARASADFWRSEVMGHTKLIGLTQPGKKTLKPCEEPYWSVTEGVEEEAKKKGKTHEKPI